MYKTKVQELCQKRSWPLPQYQTSREGPDHNPHFTSTITVNGIPFHSPSPNRTAKLAQNEAAMLAFFHFSPPSPSPLPLPLPSPSISLPDFSSFPQPSLCTVTTGAPSPSSDVVDLLPTNGVLQSRLEVCQTSEISSPVTAVKNTLTEEDHKNMSHLFKNQLQSYCQKRNLNLPVYGSEWEGPPHAMRFKCKVTVDGQTYEGDKFYSSLKDAEHSAAEVALKSILPDGVEEDHNVLYKNLLQEMVQKHGFHLPSYTTNKSGEAHLPKFVSQVEVVGKVFTGQEAKSKKQAEMNAAKVAYMALKDRKGKSDQGSLFPLSTHQGQVSEFSPDCPETDYITGMQHHADPKSPVSPGSVNQYQPIKDKGMPDNSLSSNHSESNANPTSLVIPGLVTGDQHDKNKVKKGSSSSGNTGNTNGCTEDASLSNDKSTPSLFGRTEAISDTSKTKMVNPSNTPSRAEGTPSQRRKVVYSRNTNVQIEVNGTLMPVSDDKWVAYSYSH